MRYIVGVDEAGRGPLAGPVVAAAVCLPPQANLPGVQDSKTLTAARREVLYDQIRNQALAVGLGVVWPEVIDRINILQATHRAMVEAVVDSGVQPDLLLVDGLWVSRLDMAPQVALVKGDALCLSIAAASIVAKVERDRIMVALDQEYPGYGFSKHKGYPTKEHIAAIQALGLCPQHRRTFCQQLQQTTLDLSS
ncbi:MAG TPA: ribonuclease HII [Firmicutes bacterium]|nr:ribonuclease HII [Bacillota bacterium]